VADLLECLIQIKGVADTPRRLAQRLEADQLGPRASVARRMAEAESSFARCLSLMLGADRPALPAVPRANPGHGLSGSAGEGEEGTCEDWQAQFSARRAETVAVLDACSADQLNRVGVEPTRGAMTVADLVALMLAHDTDCLGELKV
jgi:hypothetical protein